MNYVQCRLSLQTFCTFIDMRIFLPWECVPQTFVYVSGQPVSRILFFDNERENFVLLSRSVYAATLTCLQAISLLSNLAESAYIKCNFIKRVKSTHINANHLCNFVYLLQIMYIQ